MKCCTCGGEIDGTPGLLIGTGANEYHDIHGSANDCIAHLKAERDRFAAIVDSVISLWPFLQEVDLPINEDCRQNYETLRKAIAMTEGRWSMSDTIPDLQELVRCVTVLGEPHYYVKVSDAQRLLKQLVAVKSELSRTRNGLRLCIAMHSNEVWTEVSDADVDGYVDSAEKRRAELEAKGGGT